MPLSKPIPGKTTAVRVLDFAPPRLDLGIPGAALDLADLNKGGSRFKLSELTREQTGLSKLEAENFERQVEEKVVGRLKEVEENAYSEAFELGLIEGRKQAFETQNAEIDERLRRMDQLADVISTMKRDLLAYNESHLIQLAFHMAERLAAHEIEINKEATVEILRQAVEIAQTEEEIIARVAPEQIEFLESLRVNTGREFEFLKKIRFDADPSIEGGGCVLQTNYGEIDSRFEQRVEQLWESLKENLVKVKPELKSVS